MEGVILMCVTVYLAYHLPLLLPFFLFILIVTGIQNAQCSGYILNPLPIENMIPFSSQY